MIVKLGKTSKRRLSTCCPEWQEIITAVINDPDCPYDIGVMCGHRGKEKQNEAFFNKASDAKYGDSDHNFMKGDKPWSEAIDLGIYSAELRDYIWNDQRKYLILAKFILRKAAGLGYFVEWGGSYRLRGGDNDPYHFSLKLKRTQNDVIRI